jgi:RpiB/LacA/LacB family sugar-phosphate isomerase
LGAAVIRALLERSGVAADQVSQVILGQVLTAGSGQNAARQATLKAGLPHAVPAMTINVVCGSGLKAVMLAAQAVRDGDADLGIVLGGSGQGEQLAANKVRGVRAALCNDLYTARMARAHNDANVLSMGARVVGIGLAEEILATFLSTPFEGGRHQRRVDQLTALEQEF